MAGNSAATAMMKEAAALMRDAGLTVLASSGWESRGTSSSVNYWAVIAHHTAATDDIDSMLINGRSDLPGPLCNWALHENGDWVLIASGKANHAGEGTVNNSEAQGIEATGPQGYPDTYGPAAFPHNYNAYEIGCACLLAAMDANTGDLFGHKETARPAGRKIDPWFDMNPFRTGVAEGGGMEDDLSAEAERQIDEIYKGMIVPGTTTVTQSYEKLFDRVKKIEDALQVPGNETIQKSVEVLYRRVQKIEDGIDLICANLGIPFDQVDPSTITG